MQVVHRADAVLLGLDDDRIADPVLVVQPEVGRRRAAARERDRQAVRHVLLRQADLLRDLAVGVNHDPRRVEDLLHVHVDRARHPGQLARDLVGHRVVPVVLLDRAADLDVDRRRQSEVEDLADDVGGLGEEFEIGKAPRQLIAQRLQIDGRRTVLRAQRDEDFPVGRSDADAVAQRQVDVVQQADVVGDHAQFVGGNHLAQIVFDLLEVDLRLLDPRARRAPDVQPQLAGVDSGKEVAANERVQAERGDGKGDEGEHRDPPVLQHPGEARLIGRRQAAESRRRNGARSARTSTAWRRHPAPRRAGALRRA